MLIEESKIIFDNMAHAGFLSWAISNNEIQEAFKGDTGKNIKSLTGRSGIEIMIDEATGYDKNIIASFIVWVTENFWNPPEECRYIEAYQKATADLKKYS